MLITPDRLDDFSCYDLLRAVERGRLGFDHRLIRSLDRRRDEAVAALARFISEPVREDRVVDLAEQVFDLFRHFRCPEALPLYVRMLMEAGTDVPVELLEALSEIGEPAVGALIEALDRAGEDERPEVLFALAALGVRDSRILRLLEESLDQDVFEGALALGLYGDPAGRAALESKLAELAPDRADERRAVTEALGQLAQTAVRAEPVGYDVFELYPELAEPPIFALPEADAREFLLCTYAPWREGAAMTFCDEEYSEETGQALWRAAHEDESVEVRGACLRALGERLEEPAVRDFLRDVHFDASRSREERAGALMALARLSPGDKRVRQAILSLYAQDESREAALEAMWRSLDVHFAEYFLKHAQDPDPELRRQAIQGIGAFGLPDGADLLPANFDVEDLREDALYAYALALPGKTTRKSVLRLLEKVEEEAGGLSQSELELVQEALDTRLERDGLQPVFHPGPEPEEPEPPSRPVKAGRNDPCPCGSGKKYKKCCGA